MYYTTIITQMNTQNQYYTTIMTQMNTWNQSTRLLELNCLQNPWVGQESNCLLQSVGTLAYCTVIIHCIVVFYVGIIPSYNTMGIIPQSYIRTNTPTSPKVWMFSFAYVNIMNVSLMYLLAYWNSSLCYNIS